MSWWGECPANSVGRVLHFIYEYCGLKYAESVTVGSDGIFYYNKKFAEITEWKEIDIYEQKVIVPIFKFIPDTNHHFTNDNYFTEQQGFKMRCAIMALAEMREKLGERWIQLSIKEMNDRQKAINERYGYKGD